MDTYVKKPFNNSFARDTARNSTDKTSSSANTKFFNIIHPLGRAKKKLPHSSYTATSSTLSDFDSTLTVSDT